MQSWEMPQISAHATARIGEAIFRSYMSSERTHDNIFLTWYAKQFKEVYYPVNDELYFGEWLLLSISARTHAELSVIDAQGAEWCVSSLEQQNSCREDPTSAANTHLARCATSDKTPRAAFCAIEAFRFHIRDALDFSRKSCRIRRHSLWSMQQSQSGEERAATVFRTADHTSYVTSSTSSSHDLCLLRLLPVRLDLLQLSNQLILWSAACSRTVAA